MKREEVKNYINHIDANGLVDLCNDINKWKYKSGELDPCCTLNHLAENLQYQDLRDLETMILDTAYEKFGEVISLLIKTDVSRFLK